MSTSSHASPFADPKFAPLREMESYTDAMFNRIIAFQEKKHPAWDSALPFTQRIKDLPLHNLVFSNPDRNPAQHAVTVAPYYPLREELRMLVYLARQVAKDPVILDAHAGNGFIGSLLAREGATVIGVRDPAAKRNQIESFYDPEFYSLREQPLETVDFPFDVAFSSWMPAGQNLTPQLLRHRPKLVFYVYTDAVDQKGQSITGVPAAFENLPEPYQLVAEWTVTRPKDLFHDVWPDLTPSPELHRHTRIYAAEPYAEISLEGIQPATPYDWESDLEMALLALEAKELLRAQGVVV